MLHQNNFSMQIFKCRKISPLFIFLLIALLSIGLQKSFAGPPQFNPIGEERYLNSNIFVVEGNEVEFTVSAEDPDGDELTISAFGVPGWASFNETTGIFSGIAPYWSDDDLERDSQQNVYDVTFEVSDGTYTVRKIVSIYVLDTSWADKTVAELIANRPIKSGGEIGTSVDISNIQEETIQSTYGGGKTLRKITFAFTSQVPDIDGWEDDWVSTINYVFLPEAPAAQNVGAIIEGSYAQDFGDTELAERACAELDLPVLIIDRSWDFFHGGDLMEKYDSLAVVKRNPEYLFYTFATAHYLRSIDALITVINQKTDWQVSFSDFKVVFTGHSKFGHTCHNAAAADPDRVAGFLANGSTIIDTGASRMLGNIQGALGTKPEAFVNYRAVMERYFFESLKIESQMAPDVQALVVQGTDDDKNRSSGYTPKYIMLTADEQMVVPHAIGCLANAPHTTQTQLHPVYWTMWIAHCFLDRPISHVDSVYHYYDGDRLMVAAKISGDTDIRQVVAWASDQNDMDISSWNGFSDYSMTKSGDLYIAEIPSDSKTYFIEVRDVAAGVRGLIASPPMPVDCDYPLLPLAPGKVENFQAEVTSSSVNLSWENPETTDFVGILIRYSTNDFPANPTDGELVYDGQNTSTTHAISLENNLYYSAFAYDSQGNYSDPVKLLVEGTTDTEDEPKANIPDHFELSQNHPNPFNPATVIKYQLPIKSHVTIKIYDLLGNEIRSLVDGKQPAGFHSVVWDGKNDFGSSVASGIYFYQINANNEFKQTKRMLLLK